LEKRRPANSNTNIPSKNSANVCLLLQWHFKTCFSWSYAKGNYSIAKQYGITVEELEKNPAVVANLPIGFNYLSKELTNKVQPGDWNTAYKRYSKSTNKPAPVKYSNYEVQPKKHCTVYLKLWFVTRWINSAKSFVKRRCWNRDALKVPSKTAVLD
jgi:hypothetical protein